MFRPWESKIEQSVVHQELNNNNTPPKKDLKYDLASESVLIKEGRNQHIDLNCVVNFLRGHGYPSYVSTKNEKSNFRRQCKVFKLENDILIHKKTMAKTIIDVNERKQIIHMVHNGSDNSAQSSALSSHHGRDATQRLLKSRFFWPNMTVDIKNYIKQCKICQQVNPASLKFVPELKSVPVPKKIFKQIGVDLITLPLVNNFRYVAVAVCYFSKWCEARPFIDKTAESVAKFIYDEIICRHGCTEIQISDQGREFVNKLSEELFKMTGTQQKVTSPYHSQANGLVERLNSTLKTSLLKVQQNDVFKWPDILQGVLFAYRTAVHTSTKYSPFFMLYQREPVLPIDVDNNEDICISDDISDDFDFDFDEVEFSKTIETMLQLRVVENKAKKNIDEAQLRQRESYAKRHSKADTMFNPGDKVLLKNLRRNDRKGGWSVMLWIGPFTIESISDKNTCTLKKGDRVLKSKQHLKNIKKFYESSQENHIFINSEGEIELISSPQNVEPMNTYKMLYRPISKYWMVNQCKALKLDLSSIKCKVPKQTKPLTTPKKLIDVLGDGNCWYRCISEWINGTEEHHELVRLKLYQFYMTDNRVKAYVGDMELYLDINPLNIVGTWATDVEIFATALMLNTNIYIYSDYHKSWQLFGKKGTYKDGVRATENCLYMCHINRNHYSVVADVNTSLIK